MDKSEKLQKFFSEKVFKAFSDNDNLDKLKKSYTFGMRRDESIPVLEFLMKQTHLSDALRYLVEKEIAENGIRDLSKYIPSVRGQAFFDKGNKNTTEFKEAILKPSKEEQSSKSTQEKTNESNLTSNDNSDSLSEIERKALDSY